AVGGLSNTMTKIFIKLVQRRANDMSEHKTPFSAFEYGPVVAELLVPPRLAPLGRGSPNRAVEARLRSLTPADLFAPHRLVDADMVAACLAGLWFYHDFLDESHTISQSLDTTSGSYWHGLMHRREPDASNAAYWFRRVGEHPVFEGLARDVPSLGLRLASNHWDPFSFIDLCEKHRGAGSSEEDLLRRVQRREW